MSKDTLLYAAVALLLIAVICFLIAWWGVHREEKRGFSYEPLKPDDE